MSLEQHSNQETPKTVDMVNTPLEKSLQVEQIIKTESKEENTEKLNQAKEELIRLLATEDSLEKDRRWIKLENHTFDENGFYRVVDEKGFKDFLESGVVRSAPDGTDSHIVGRFDIGHRPTPFPSFSKGVPDLSYARKDSDNYIFESNIPMYKKGEKNPVTESSIKGRHWAYRPIDTQTGTIVTEMTSAMIKNIYKLDKENNLYIEEKK